MAKRQINFIGPSIQELGLENNNGITNIAITQKGNTNIYNTQGNYKKIENEEENAQEINNGNTIITNAINGDAKDKRAYNTVQFRLIRDYLYSALGNNDQVKIKLSVMGQELGINVKTLYKHLKMLRETEFFITKQQYCTQIKRRWNRNEL